MKNIGDIEKEEFEYVLDAGQLYVLRLEQFCIVLGFLYEHFF
jgi:hypothetical protein